MVDPQVVPPTPGEQAADRAAGNAALRAAAEIVAKIASLALLFVLAREFGPEGLGIYVFALAWSELTNLPVDMGFDRYLTRQIARDRANIERLVLNVMATKVLRAGPVLFLSVLLVNLLGYSSGQREAVYVAAVAVMFDSLSGTIMAVFTGLEHGGLVAAVLVSQRLLAAALGLVAVAAGLGVVAVLAGYAVSTMVALALAVVLMQRRLGRLRLEVSRAGRREVGRRTAGLAAQEVLSTGIARADVVLLSLLGTTAAVGQYGAGYRLMESTLFITLALTSAFAAMFTYLDRHSEPTIQAVYGYALKAVTGLLMPCAVTLFILPGPAVELLFGDGFEGAVNPLRLLAPVVALLGIVLISYSLVISRRDPRVVAWAFAGALAVNVLSNLALIGPFGASGAAASMLLTEGLLAVAMYQLAARTVGRPQLVHIFAAPAVAAAAMALCMTLLVDVPLLAAAAGAATYLAVLLATERALNPDDLRNARGIIRRRLAGWMRWART